MISLTRLDNYLIKSTCSFPFNLIKFPFYEPFLHINIHFMIATNVTHDCSTYFQQYFSKAGLTPVEDIDDKITYSDLEGNKDK